MNDRMLIRAKDLSVSYDGREVLFCPELTVYERDFIGVTGPNGGGKTTLIRALLKSIPYRGEVIYGDPVAARGVRRIGYLPQVYPVDRSFPIPVREVVLSGLQARKGMKGRYRVEDRKQVESLLEMTGIYSLRNSPIENLSGGEFQRMMLCRALISEPMLLILDEPDNFVDDRFESELHRLLTRLNERMAILMVSHAPDTIARLARTIVQVDRRAIVTRFAGRE
jgi:zinc transport system ATP-binding protein